MTPNGRLPGVRQARPRRARAVVYLVSGDDSIRPSDEVLRRSGRRVRFDAEVGDEAAVELRSGGRFVVVAHGRSDGAVMWFSSVRGVALRWLWVGMPSPPSGARVYVYACLAGQRLVPFLRRCEAFGHTDEVPMPTGGARHVVLRYLTEVDRLLGSREFDVTAWRTQLGEHVNRAYVAEVERRTGLLAAAALLMLRRSLAYPDE